jgi:hypothetical protein
MRARGVAMAETKAAAHCAGAQLRAAEIQFTASIFCIGYPLLTLSGPVCAALNYEPVICL